ncbi:MAG: hypothetical protein ACYT04_49350, partial [Nostoc sp.]
MSKELQELQKLLNQAHTLLDQVLDHPYYQKLLEKGFTPENTIFDIQKSIVFLELDIKKFTQKSMLENLSDVIASAKLEASKTIAEYVVCEAEMLENLSDVIASAKLEASKKIAEYIVSEAQKQGVTLADLLLGFGQVAFSRGLEES